MPSGVVRAAYELEWPDGIALRQGEKGETSFPLLKLKSGKLAPEVLNAKSAASKAEALRAAADKKLTQTKEALARAKTDTDTSEEKLEELTKAVEKAQAALADAEKRLDKAKADLAKAEADAQKK